MWITLSIILVLATSSPVSAEMSYDPVKAEAQIRENSQTWASVAVTGNTSVLETLFADDMVGTDPSGRLYTKREFIEYTEANPPGFTSNIVNDVKIRFFGNVAVAQGNETFTRKDGVSNRFACPPIDRC